MQNQDTAHDARLRRGVRLYREHGEQIERVSAHTYRVPSCSGEGHYTVWTDLRACDCPDHPRAKAQGTRCKHYHAALIVQARRRAAGRREVA